MSHLEGSCVIGKHVRGDNILSVVHAVKIIHPSKGQSDPEKPNSLSEQTDSEQSLTKVTMSIAKGRTVESTE